MYYGGCTSNVSDCVVCVFPPSPSIKQMKETQREKGIRRTSHVAQEAVRPGSSERPRGVLSMDVADSDLGHRKDWHVASPCDVGHCEHKGAR